MANVMVTLQKLANENTAKTFKYNAQEAKTSRDWQKMMSDTAHQREVTDLKNAGLNPVLAANSGAQSYSTQSASATADSAVNAIGNVESSRTSAAATRYAAEKSLAASQAVASAQRYAAAMAYEAQKYHSDRAYEAAIESKKWDYKIKMDSPVSNPAGIVDKLLSNAGLYGAVRENVAPKVQKTASKILNNPGVYIAPSKGTEINKNNFVLTSKGKSEVAKALKEFGIANTSFNQRLFVLSTNFNDQSASKYLERLIKNSNLNKSVNSARWSKRSGSGIW